MEDSAVIQCMFDQLLRNVVIHTANERLRHSPRYSAHLKSEILSKGATLKSLTHPSRDGTIDQRKMMF
jgi:hypothetical protein